MQSQGVSRLSADLDRTRRTFSFLRLPNYGRLRNIVVTVSLNTGTTKTGEWKKKQQQQAKLNKINLRTGFQERKSYSTIRENHGK